MWRAFGEPLKGFEIEPTRIRELGEGLLAHVTFRGSATGAKGSDPRSSSPAPRPSGSGTTA